VEGSARRGSLHHDPIEYDADGDTFRRPSNRAGGIEGGISNGQAIRIRGYLKPLSTLTKPLPSVDLVGKEPFQAAVERTDTIPIVAAGVVGEAMACLVLADEFLRKFGGDSMPEVLRNHRSYLDFLADY
jgi:chorismate synthase